MVLASPVPAATELLITLLDASQTTERIAVSLGAPDGSTVTARDDDGDGTVVITPESGPGEYQLTVVLGERRDTRTVTVPSSGVVVLTYVADPGGGLQATVSYDTESFNEEIVVTARKREERLQEVPIAVTVLSDETMEAQSMRDLNDIGDFTPNLDVSMSNGITGGPSEATVYIRGIGQIDTEMFTDPGVGIYVDGVYLARAQGSILDLLDLERVEVLRGPQGTLFGKNTTGGAISFISRRPHGEPVYMVELTTGAYSRRDLKARLNLPPLAEGLFASLALSLGNRDGYAESLATGERFNDDNRDSARGALRWLASDDVVLDLTVDYYRERETALDMTLLGVAQTPLLEFYNRVTGDAGLPIIGEGFVTGDLTRSYSTGRRYADGDVLGTSLTVDWSILDSVSLRSISAYRRIDFKHDVDADGTPLTFLQRSNHQQQNQLSQEIQLSGRALDDRLTWLAGGLYFTESSHDESWATVWGEIFGALEAAPGPIYAPPFLPSSLCDPGPPPPGMPCLGGAGNPFNMMFYEGDGDFTRIQLETSSAALFGEATMSVTDKLSVTAGLRYTYEEKQFDYFVRYAHGIPDVALYNRDSWDALSPRLSLSYRATQDLLLYTSAAHGFKSGGFNGRPQQRGVLDPFDPESLWAYELGFKSDWSNRRLRLNGAFFYYDYTDIQFSAGLADDDGRAVFVLQNAGKARAWGYELEITARPAHGWLWTATVAHIDTQYTELDDVEPNGVTLDSKFPKTPEWSLTLSPQYSFGMGNAGKLTLRADYSYRSKIYNDVSNSPLVTQEGYGLLHASTVFLPASESWELALFGTNLTGEEYLVHGMFIPSLGPAIGVAGRPREWGLTTKLRF
jgi:iron complex outermembrane receptor protein